MSVYVTEDHLKQARELAAAAEKNEGLAPLDIERFWSDQEKAKSDPWADDCPQVPLGIMMSHECVFSELGLQEDWYRLVHDTDYAADAARRYNDKSEKIVGRRLLGQEKPDPARAWPAVKGLHDIFEAKNVWQHESYWLNPSAGTPDELRALLDRVEERLEDLRAFLLPRQWAEEKERLTKMGCAIQPYRGQRGPVTFAMSVFGVENLIFLIMDEPDLAGRFRDLIIRAIVKRALVLDEEAGLTKDTRRKGWYWCDDNCAMLNAEMYEFFGYPILKAVFEEFSPGAGDLRGQHSDSDMGHLLPLLSRLRMSSVNFGPNLTVAEIREHLPKAVINGQLAPFTFSRNEETNIVAECIRDCEMARKAKGLVFATAGSINNGSRLTGMRLIMAAIQKYGRY